MATAVSRTEPAQSARHPTSLSAGSTQQAYYFIIFILTDSAKKPVEPHEAGTIAPFSQTEFFDPGDQVVGLSGVGYIYVPTTCREARCRLHVAFHGCRQNADAKVAAGCIHDDFVRDAGYNRWAAANSILVLYPQATANAANPNACWDFWGYSGTHYRNQRAPQIRAVRAMVARLLGQQ